MRGLTIPQERPRSLAKSGHDYCGTALFDNTPEQPIRVLLGSADSFEQSWHEHLRLEARQGHCSYVVLGLQEARLSSAGFLRQLLRSDIAVIGDNSMYGCFSEEVGVIDVQPAPGTVPVDVAKLQVGSGPWLRNE